MPVDLGEIELYAGDPKTIQLRILEQDISASTFSSQIRHRAKDNVTIDQFEITKFATANIVDPTKTDTIVSLLLPGDTAPGLADGRTRFPEGVRTASFDVQEWTVSGAKRTLAVGKLVQTQDVTR